MSHILEVEGLPREAKLTYKKLLSKRSRDSWRSFIERNSDEDHYGLYFKVIRHNIPTLQSLVSSGEDVYSSEVEVVGKAMEQFFPASQEPFPSLEEIEGEVEMPCILFDHEEPLSFTINEVEDAISHQFAAYDKVTSPSAGSQRFSPLFPSQGKRTTRVSNHTDQYHSYLY